jgi:hypothetical protein
MVLIGMKMYWNAVEDDGSDACVVEWVSYGLTRQVLGCPSVVRGLQRDVVILGGQTMLLRNFRRQIKG